MIDWLELIVIYTFCQFCQFSGYKAGPSLNYISTNDLVPGWNRVAMVTKVGTNNGDTSVRDYLFYINGVLDGSLVNNYGVSSTLAGTADGSNGAGANVIAGNLYIGNPTYQFTGYLSRIINIKAVMTPAEIQSLTSGFVEPLLISKLKYWLNFEAKSQAATTVYEVGTSSGNNGTLINFSTARFYNKAATPALI